MTSYGFDGTVNISANNVTNSSSNPHVLNVDGDTIRIVNPRSVTFTGSGNVGELCWRSVTVLGITTYYLCLYNGTNWIGTAFSNLPI